MIAATLAIFLVDGVLVLGLLWISVNALHRQKRLLVSAMNLRRLGNATRVIMVAPPLVILIVFIIFFLVIQNDYFLRFAQTFFLLGFWMATAISIFALLLLMRLRHILQLAVMLGFLGAFIPVLYCTPISRFQDIFGQAGQIGYAFPLIEGLAIIGVCYFILLRLDSVLH